LSAPTRLLSELLTKAFTASLSCSSFFGVSYLQQGKLLIRAAGSDCEISVANDGHGGDMVSKRQQDQAEQD
jgi:hypothetical protein